MLGVALKECPCTGDLGLPHPPAFPTLTSIRQVTSSKESLTIPTPQPYHLPIVLALYHFHF